MAVDRREVLRISLRFPGERKHLWPLLDFQIVVRFLVSASSSVPFPPAVSQVFDKSRSTESSADLGIGGSLSDQLQGQMARSSRLVLSLMRLSLGRADRTAPAVARRGYQLSNVGRLSTLSLPIDSEHTAKWMTNSDKKSPMELIAEIPPIEAHFRVVACEGGGDPSLGHPIEYINLDLGEPATCKYCGLRYVLAPDSHAH